MKNRTMLSLMDMLSMVLVFAVSAAICLRAFSKADVLSRTEEERSAACRAAASLTEVLKAEKGDLAKVSSVYGGRLDGAGTLAVMLDASYEMTEGEGGRRMEARLLDNGNPYLGTAEVTVFSADGQIVLTMSAAWQTDGEGQP